MHVCVVLVVAGASSTALGQPAAPSSTSGGSAQPASLAPTVVLANVQRYYVNANQLTAQFRQIVTNATFNTTNTNDGTLWVAKPAQFRWDYAQKKQGRLSISKTFIFDGQTFWVIDHNNKQIVQAQTRNSSLPAAVSFLTGGSNLGSQFNVALNTSGTIGGSNATVLELTPKQPSAQYTKLYFVVDPSNWRVKESIVIDSSGDTNMFKFFAPNLTSTVKPQWFQVNPSSMPTYALVVAGAQGGSGSGAQQPPAPATTGSGSVSAPTP